MALQPPSPTAPLYAGTTITTFMTTLSVDGPGGTTLYYPWPAVTGPPVFTTITALEGIRTESVLVVTDVVGVILGADGRVLRTATLKHKDPKSTGGTTATDTRCLEFKCWTSAQQGGTIFAAVLVGLLLLGLLIWFLKKEKSRREGRGEVIMPATLVDGRNREKVIVEDLERGERHRRRKSRHRRERSPSPVESTGSSSIVEERRKSKHRSSKNHHVRYSRDERRREEENVRHSSRYQAEPVRMPSPPKPSRASYVKSPRDSQPPTSQPTAFMPPEPAHVTPSRDPFYSPRVRDFAEPGPPADVARSRERSPTRDRDSRRFRGNSDIITVEVEEDQPPQRERRRRRRRSMGEERIEREDAGRERRRRERSIDSDGRRQSLSQPAPRKQPTKQKKSTFLENAKWLALLPLALRAIHIVAEPNGGWEQYFCSEEAKEKRKKRARSSGPEPQRRRFVQQDHDRHPERWSARSGGPYLEDSTRRSSSADSDSRSHACSSLKPRRHESPRFEEPFQRRRPRRQHDRVREERSPGLDEAASEDGSVHRRRKAEQQLSVLAPMEVRPKKIRHSRRSEPVVRSDTKENEEPHMLEDGNRAGRAPLEHVISKSRPLKIPSRFDTASSDTLVG